MLECLVNEFIANKPYTSFMNILMLNWRDPKNPYSGGAEKLNLEILRPFAERGDKIIWYAQAVEGLPSKEIINGIEIRRFGNVFMHLFLWPFLYWTKKFGRIDFIIDSIHGTGYLSPIFAPRVKKVVLICEVAQNVWDEAFPFPINRIGKIWEKIMLRFYGKNKFWTISNSTKIDLIRFGVPTKNLHILPMGFDAIALRNKPVKYKNPTALFVGRLAEMKGVKDAIRAIAQLNKNSSTKWALNIIGSGRGSYEGELKALVSKLNIRKYVNFMGRVPEKKKFEEMSKAWVLLVPSSREGWGMIVPEANHVGTPAIGYNSPGLSESLAKYSELNIAIKGEANGIVRELKKIPSPLKVVTKISPGWNKLHSFVLDKYK